MLGLYSLGFAIVWAIGVLTSQVSGYTKFFKLLAFVPVVAYIIITMKAIEPLYVFVMANLETFVGK